MIQRLQDLNPGDPDGAVELIEHWWKNEELSAMRLHTVIKAQSSDADIVRIFTEMKNKGIETNALSTDEEGEAV